jgi:RecA/RadA recombinase
MTCDILNEIYATRGNRPTGFSSGNDLRSGGISLPHFYWQYLFGNRRIPTRCLLDLIGGENIGKTTLGLSMISWAIKYDQAFGLWIETEGKPLWDSRIARIMDSNPQRAFIMQQRGLARKTAHSLDEMVEVMTDWVLVLRGKRVGPGKKSVCVHISQPLVVFVDTLSKLMSPAEATGHYEYGKYMQGEKPGKSVKAKAIGDGSNFNHAKFIHEWARKLPSFLAENNVLLICAHHQNDKINMSGFGLASFMTEDTAALYNKTKIGGRATNQNAAFQLIMTQAGSVKNSAKAVVGRKVKIRMDKNTYGPHGRQISYEVHTEHVDMNNEWAPVLVLDNDILTWLAENSYLPIRAETGGRWSWSEKGLMHANASDLVNALHQDKELLVHLGGRLKIEGYLDPVLTAIAEGGVLEQNNTENEFDNTQDEEIPGDTAEQ